MRLMQVEQALAFAFRATYYRAVDAAIDYANATMTRAYIRDNGSYADSLEFYSVSDPSPERDKALRVLTPEHIV